MIESLTTHDVTRTRAPSHTEGVLDRFNDMYEEVQTLRERVGCRSVVEELRGACKSHLGVHQEMGKNSPEPVLLGDLWQSVREHRLDVVSRRLDLTISASRAAMNLLAPPGSVCTASRP